MPQQGLIFRVLVASPSDCEQERKAIPEVICSWNAANSFRTAAMLDAVLWETHATPEFGDRPQALLNKQLVEKCDLLVGVFWTRLGTSTGEAESGTAEEIEEFRKAGKPVLLYFSSVHVIPLSIDLEQYNALIEYKKKLQGQGLVFSYDSVSEFRQLLQTHLSSTMGTLLEKYGAPKSSLPAESEPVQAIKMFKSQFESFLRRLEAEWSAERDTEPAGTDDGKYILQSAIAQLLDFKAQIVKDEGSEMSSILQDSLKRLKELTKHQVYIDGGKSYKEFWNKGDETIELLKRVPHELEKALA